MKCKLLPLFLLFPALMLGGCSSTGYSSGYNKSSDVTYIRDINGMTQYRIQDGNVFTPTGTRIARIDSSGNIFNTTGSRLGRVGKK
jgi:hypothetical protein